MISLCLKEDILRISLRLTKMRDVQLLHKQDVKVYTENIAAKIFMLIFKNIFRPYFYGAFLRLLLNVIFCCHFLLPCAGQFV